MLGIGILMLVFGALFVTFAFLMPTAQLQPDQAQKLHQLEAQLHMSLSTVFITAGSVLAGAGLYHVVMSFFVRRGGRPAIYTTIVSSFLVIGWCVLSALNGLMSGAGDAGAGVCFLAVIGAIFIWLVLWLFQALRGTGSSAAAARYQAQYWQMLQQHTAYAQQPGMGVPPPPMSPPAPPPPPQPPAPEPPGWAYGSQTPPPSPPPPSAST
jgi:hypothetical protein